MGTSAVRKSQFHGVRWHAGNAQWNVQLKIGGKPVSLYYSDDELSAAWVADFVRYMVFGPDHRKWSAKAGTPNFAPCRFDGVSRAEIIGILLDRGLVDVDLLRDRLAEYDRLVDLTQVATTCQN